MAGTSSRHESYSLAADCQLSMATFKLATSHSTFCTIFNSPPFTFSWNYSSTFLSSSITTHTGLHAHTCPACRPSSPPT